MIFRGRGRGQLARRPAVYPVPRNVTKCQEIYEPTRIKGRPAVYPVPRNVTKCQEIYEPTRIKGRPGTGGNLELTRQPQK
jgi:hypothetical protein